MKKRYFLLVGLLPLFYACSNKTSVATIKNQDYPIINEEESEEEACTVMYVGKGVSTNGKAIIARTGDSSPNAMCLNMTMFPHNALANQIVTSNTGFTYKMPSTTYRYVSTPRNPIMHKGNHWEVSAINENGVGVSATLTCYPNEDVKNVDPLIPTGIGEDNIAQIVGATARTAREGIETIANIIDTHGACGGNAIMTIDQNEAWYMEIYSGYQYAAIKMPDDKMLTAGNEYVFDSLDHMGIREEDTILSDKLLTTLADVKGEDKRVFDDDINKDVRHLKLAETYGKLFSDGSHTRTWRGYNLFADETTYQDTVEQYAFNPHEKYDAFYTPRRNLDFHDVTTFMRDRYEDVLARPSGDSTGDEFRRLNNLHELRYVGIETAYQIHIVQSDKELPNDIAAMEWMCISNSNYAPFIPISCAADHLSNYYTKVSPTFSYDEGSAAHIYKKLNTLARTDRENYGIPIRDLWIEYEYIFEKQYHEIIKQIKNLDRDARAEILGNYITKTQDDMIRLTKFMIDDLTWHMMNDSFQYGTPTKFKPCVNVRDYALMHGYSYEKSDKTVIFAKGNEHYSLTLTNEEFLPGYDYRTIGEITYDNQKNNIEMIIDGNEVYVPYINLIDYIKGDLVININDYRTPFNHAVWIVPTAIGVPIIAGSILSFSNIKIRKKRKKK